MTVMERLARSVVVPVVVLEKAEDAIPTAKAMLAGGVDTMEITFTADGVVNSGSFDVDFASLQYSGTVTGTERSSITHTLKFWPKGDRTTTWTFGNYSDSYILYLENFTVTSAKGSIYLKNS